MEIDSPLQISAGVSCCAVAPRARGLLSAKAAALAAASSAGLAAAAAFGVFLPRGGVAGGGRGMNENPRSVVEGWGLDLSLMNRSVHPGDDFINFVAGPRLGSSDPLLSSNLLDAIDQQRDLHLREILEQDGGVGGQLYSALMDRGAVKAAGVAGPLAEGLGQIRAMTTRAEVAAWLAKGCRADIGMPLMTVDLEVHHLDPDTTALMLTAWPMEINLTSAAKYDMYSELVKSVLGMAGWDAGVPSATAAAVSNLDAELSRQPWNFSRLVVSFPDAEKRMTVGALADSAPGLDFLAFVRGLPGLQAMSRDDTVLVRGLGEEKGDGIVGLSRVLGAADLDTLKSWLAFHFSFFSLRYLDSSDGGARALWNQKSREVIYPSPEPSSQWAHAVGIVNDVLPSAVGKLYLESYYWPQKKVLVDQMAPLVVKAFQDRVRGAEWISGATRNGILRKLRGLSVVTGAMPSPAPVDHSAWAFNSSDLLGSIRRAVWAEQKAEYSFVGRPAKYALSRWKPQEGGRRYRVQTNTVWLAAGFMNHPSIGQVPDAAFAFGSIGFFIGQVVAYSVLPEQARHFDSNGTYAPLWAAADLVLYLGKADALKVQVQGMLGLVVAPPEGSFECNVKALDVAVDAFKLWREGDGADYQPEGPWLVQDGNATLEGLRRVFVGYAQVGLDASCQGCHVSHPAWFLASMRNSADWHLAFGVHEEHLLYLKYTKRLSIW